MTAYSVARRSAEIGIRMALGASRRAVSSFFIAEQLFLAMVGGVMGYALGIILARAVGIGISWLETLTGLKSVPMTLIKPPGATGLVWSAELTIFEIRGIFTAAS